MLFRSRQNSLSGCSMNFIQPWILLALPLVAVPIIIHLVNQRRFQTVPWAAMMFLLQASRMSSGYTKLRQWLILLMRALAVACLVFFTSRPLASGLIGLLGSRSSEVAIVLLDRSPSMQETRTGTGITKLQSALTQLSSTLKTLGVQRGVVFDSARDKPFEFESPEAMVSDPSLVANGITSDVPGMLERALIYKRVDGLISFYHFLKSSVSKGHPIRCSCDCILRGTPISAYKGLLMSP